MRNSLILPLAWSGTCFRFATDGASSANGAPAGADNISIRDNGLSYALKSLEPPVLATTALAGRIPRNSTRRRVRGLRAEVQRMLFDVGFIAAGTTSVQIWHEIPVIRFALKSSPQLLTTDAAVLALPTIAHFGLTNTWAHVDLAIPDGHDNLYITADELSGFTTGQMEDFSGNWRDRGTTNPYAGTGVAHASALVEFLD